jgi:hypothetical protein
MEAKSQNVACTGRFLSRSAGGFLSSLAGLYIYSGVYPALKLLGYFRGLGAEDAATELVIRGVWLSTRDAGQNSLELISTVRATEFRAAVDKIQLSAGFKKLE